MTGLGLIVPRIFEGLPGVAACFSTRRGGFSGGCFSSLNLDFRRGDDAKAVHKNFFKICDIMGFQRLVFNEQVHGGRIVDIKSSAEAERFDFLAPRQEADGFVTSLPEVTLTCFYADCVPILLYDPHAGVAATAHAGWKGTLLKTPAEAIKAMRGYGSRPEDILAAVGPCICKACYEVGPEVEERFTKVFGAGPVSSYGGRPHADLRTANRVTLEEAGLNPRNIEDAGGCTCCREDEYFSHRRDGAARGGHCAFIMLKRG